jgi:hypothetical protein
VSHQSSVEAKHPVTNVLFDVGRSSLTFVPFRKMFTKVSATLLLLSLLLHIISIGKTLSENDFRF